MQVKYEDWNIRLEKQFNSFAGQTDIWIQFWLFCVLFFLLFPFSFVYALILIQVHTRQECCQILFNFLLKNVVILRTIYNQEITKQTVVPKGNMPYLLLTQYMCSRLLLFLVCFFIYSSLVFHFLISFIFYICCKIFNILS